MIVNVAEAKARFSNLLAMVDVSEDEVVISKRDKPMAVLISYEKFLKIKKRLDRRIDIKKLDTLSSSLDKYVGILGKDEVDFDYKDSREEYLKKKYL